MFRDTGGTLTGDVAVGQTVLLQANASSGDVSVTADAFTNHGDIRLDSTGGTNDATLTVGGLLDNHGTIEFTGPASTSGRLLDGDIDNHGTIHIGHGGELGAASKVTNYGTVTIDAPFVLAFDLGSTKTGTFTQEAGTLTVAAGGQFELQRDIFTFNGGTIVGTVGLEIDGALNIGPGSEGAGAFAIRDGNTTYSGNLAAAQTIRILGSSGGSATMTASAGFTNHGTIVLDSEHASLSADAAFHLTSGTLTNYGTIQISDNPALKTPPGPSAGGRLLNADLVNHGTIAVTDNAELGASKTVVNHNTFTIAAGIEVLLDGGSAGNGTITQAAGTLTVTGTLRLQEDTFNFNGGAITGVVHVTDGSTLNIGPGSEGAGDFVFRDTGNTLTGHIAAAQQVQMLGVTPNGSVVVTAPAGFTNRGRIVLDSSGGTAGVTFTVTTGTLENRGIIDILDTSASGSARTFQSDLLNLGTMNVNDNATFNKSGATYVNRGTFTIGAGNQLTLTGPGSPAMTNESPGSFAGGGTLLLAGGASFGGTGTVGVNVNNSAGHLRPGLSPGILNILGTYTQAAGSTLHVEIGGPTPGLYDQVNVTGLATLAGIVDLSVVNGICPEGSYDFMTFGSRNGVFGTFNGLSQPGGRTLVPEPLATVYRLNVTGTPCDTTPPEITPVSTGALGGNGWYVGNVVVTWTVADPESAISSKDGCGDTEVTADTAGVTFTCTATSAGGPASASVTITRDATPPAIVDVSRTPGPNANGWNNTDVTATFSASDATSGIAGDSTVVRVFAAEGAGQSGSHTFVDLAGNTATATIGGINIDKTPPNVTVSRAPAPNASGWNNTDVVATFTATDMLSGIDGTPTAMQVFTGEGANQGGSHTFVDRAGNSTTGEITGISIDKSRPALVCSITPSTIWPPNGRRVPVTASVTGTDGVSGFDKFILTAAVSNESEGIEGFIVGTADTQGRVRAKRKGKGTGRIYSFTYTGTDLAGNSGQCVVTVTVPHDQRKPKPDRDDDDDDARGGSKGVARGRVALLQGSSSSDNAPLRIDRYKTWRRV